MTRYWLKLIPGAISGMRIVIGLAFYWLPVEWRLPAVAVAALTDLLDGPTSRWLKVDGKFGQILDPIADKIFLICVLATLVLDARVMWWEMLIVGTRDVAVLLACGVLAFGDGWTTWQHMRPRLLGKATTVVQLSFVLMLVWGAEDVARILLYAAGVLGGLAFVDYAIAFRNTPAAVTANAARGPETGNR